jgi:hypothetical protein
MQNAKAQNLIFLSVGFLLKFFGKQKVLKKAKLFKLLLIRSLRKFLLLSKIERFYLFINGTPIHLLEMLRTLNQRIEHPFVDPTKHFVIDESSKRSPLVTFKIPYIFFSANVAFVPVKTRKRGRIKRKLRRRLTIKNRVTD